MDGRKRTVQIKFRVTEAERDLILEKMKLIPTRNMAAYLRKIAIDGYILQVDHTDIKAMTAEIQKIGVNVNQIAKRVNSTGSVYQEDIEEIKGVLLHDAAFLHGAGRQHLRCTEPRRRQLGARAERHPLRLHFLLQRNRVPDCNRHPACTNHGTPDLWFIRPDRPRKRSPLPPRSHPVFLRPWSCQLQPSGTAGTRRENSAVAVELY